MMTFVVLPWQMYQLTKSSLAVGLLGVTEFVPILFMAFVGGALADSVDRRRMVRLTELFMAVGCGVLIINSLLSNPRVWVLFICAAAFASLNGLQRPSLEALAPRLLHRSRFQRGCFKYVEGNGGWDSRPAIGGFLAATAGTALTYSSRSRNLRNITVALWMMKSTPPPPEADSPSLRTVIEGLRYAKSRQELMGTY